ncbi:redox-sensitive transcriptional activator SoxR [Actinoallomurus soli]|uniref:redox-sensitive transcriptional activator SoxR n=1 Tax=Actinoallomurus soli TaxID=2952535 RepID=UPI002093C1EC|nr:redox-sensitive transcriptional activator SoxR [Actinoallomurus soli]MCO5973126.1 redox-sensitive transcriptional activator SoxR [Actinoallomurus soli]
MDHQRPKIAKELTIGELSERSGVAASALRFYERQGLIHSRRTSGNQRRYHRTTLRRVAFIRAAQSVGMPLDCVGHVLNMLPPDAELTRDFWVGVSEYWQQEVNERIAKMERMRDRFTECIGCGCLSFEQCTLVNPDDVLAEQGPGPRRLLTP